MNLNAETMVHDLMHNVQYRQMDTLYEPVLFKPLKEIRVSWTMFKVTSFIDLVQYIESFLFLEKYIEQ